MTMIDVGDLKMAREALCAAQSGLDGSGMGKALSLEQSLRIEKMISQIDVLRPLSPDGKHGTLHTSYCGCDSVEHIASKVQKVTGKYVQTVCNCYLRRNHVGRTVWGAIYS